MPISNQHRVYTASNARSNQYILAELKLTDELVAAYPDLATLYNSLSQQFFTLAEDAELRNVHFLANDKLPVVRFHNEAYSLATEEQILFFYNPRYHEAQNSFYDANVRAKKISLLVLATGEDLRSQAALFHQRVKQLLQAFKQSLPCDVALKLRDHQHLSYDLFAKQKGHMESYGLKLRSLSQRYASRGCSLPDEVNEMTYVTVNLPLNRKLKQRLLPNLHSLQDYTPLYLAIQEIKQACLETEALPRTAMLANGAIPLVRNSNIDKNRIGHELHLLSFDQQHNTAQHLNLWQGDKLVDTAHFVVVAGLDDCSEYGYGRFMNQVEHGLRRFSEHMQVEPQKDDFIVRFHQHISYYL